MSAREDYPPIPVGVNRPGGWGLLHKQMCDEIDRLRRWKAEASEVLARWDAVAERFDLSGHLGDFTADAVGDEIDALLTELSNYSMGGRG